MERFKKEQFIDNYPFEVSLEPTEKIINKMKKCVCKIYKKNITGTGFFCKILNPNNWKYVYLFLTNYHIYNENDIIQYKSIQISLKNKDNQNCMKTINITNKNKIFTIKELDITFIEIEKKQLDNSIDFLEIDDSIYQEEKYYKILFYNKPIYTIHYPYRNNFLISYGIFERS